jgi:hypothetical protein
MAKWAVIHNDGWSFEMFIPYSAIRFGKKDVQTWGFNIYREKKKNGGTVYWNPIDPNVNGFLTQEGLWEGISHIKPHCDYNSLLIFLFMQITILTISRVKDWTSQVNGEWM